MKYHYQIRLSLTLALTLVFFLGLAQPLFADGWGNRGNGRGSNPGSQSWNQPQGSHGKVQVWQDAKINRGGDRSWNTQAVARDDRQDWYRKDNRGWDTRYNHNRYYPTRGHYVSELPHNYYTAYYHRSPYYFWEGVWYRPYGSYFWVIAPPVGLVIPVLPPYYTTLWVGGIPYYYANETYYTYYPGGGYVVTDPPKDQITEAAPAADWLYSYPTRGQSEKQQADDRYACHRWAVDQTGYDPTQPLGGVPESQSARKRSDYQRALGACLEGRGYSVK